MDITQKNKTSLYLLKKQIPNQTTSTNACKQDCLIPVWCQSYIFDLVCVILNQHNKKKLN